MDQKVLREREARCVQENPPGCTAGCPVHVDARGMIATVRAGDWATGFALFNKAVPFPAVISRICDQPCRHSCRRADIDDPIAVNALEKICVDNTPAVAPKIAALPPKHKKVAVAGAGLSGLTAALELARKGYGVVVYEATDRLGGSVQDIPESKLPRRLLENDFAVFGQLPVEINHNAAVGGCGGIPLASLCERFDAVYLGIGRGAAEAADLGLAADAAGAIAVDPSTLATSHPKVFAGGSLRRGEESRSPITSIADGKIAANSVDRLLQGASLAAGRDKEGPYATSLYTNIDGIAPAARVAAQSPDGGYTVEEARREADRCLLCECRECVKVCEYLAHFGSYPKRYVREVYNNLSIVMGIRHANKMINTCGLCGLCEEVCPGRLNMGEVCQEARRMMVERGKMPPSAHDFALRDMRSACGDDFALHRHQPGFASSAVAFYPGCQHAASSPRNIKKIYQHLCRTIDGGVGLMLGCCGAPANWAGQEQLFHETLRLAEKQWRELGCPKVVTACPTCFTMFRHNLPEVPVETLWTLLDRIGLPAGEDPVAPLRLAVHDSCTTRHETGLQNSVRSILGKLGHQVEELPHNRDKTVCCGYGGLMIHANREVARKVISRRIGESASDYLAYCAMCRDNFASQGKRAHYLLDLLYAAGGELAAREGPGFTQRQENRARLKRTLLREVWGEDVNEPRADVALIIPAEVRRVLEDRMILADDIAKVVAHAEDTGNKFLDTANGRYLAYFRPVSVTYWVEYSPRDDGFLVHNAYSHRIEILEQ